MRGRERAAVPGHPTAPPRPAPHGGARRAGGTRGSSSSTPSPMGGDPPDGHQVAGR